jgi:hypothetical protein
MSPIRIATDISAAQPAVRITFENERSVMRGVVHQELQNRYKVSHPKGCGKHYQLYYHDEKEAVKAKLELCVADKITPYGNKKKKNSSISVDVATGIRESVRRGKKLFISRVMLSDNNCAYKDISYSTTEQRGLALIRIEKWRLSVVRKELTKLAKQYGITLRNLDFLK